MEILEDEEGRLHFCECAARTSSITTPLTKWCGVSIDRAGVMGQLGIRNETLPSSWMEQKTRSSDDGTCAVLFCSCAARVTLELFHQVEYDGKVIENEKKTLFPFQSCENSGVFSGHFATFC